MQYMRQSAHIPLSATPEDMGINDVWERGNGQKERTKKVKSLRPLVKIRDGHGQAEQQAWLSYIYQVQHLPRVFMISCHQASSDQMNGI